MPIGRKTAQPEMITGIDIGSTAVRIAVGQVAPDMQGNAELQIIAAAEVASEGVNKGVITSIEDTVSSLSGALEHIERLVGVPIENAWIGLTGTHMMTQESRGVIAVAKSDGEISEEDVDRAVEAARTVAAPLNYEILHILPKSYCVDGQTGIKDPVGMTGIRLEVDTKIIHGVTAHIKNATKSVYRTGIDIDDLVLSVLATGDAVTSARQRELGCAVANVGGSMTSLIVYEEGDIVHTAVLPIGSEHITNDLAIGLRTSIDIAERVKIHFGECVSNGIKKKDKVDLVKVGAPDEGEVSLKYVAEIIEARASEILEKIDEELMSVDRSGLLPAGVIFTGGGAKINGLTDLAKEVLRLPASLGYPVGMHSATDKINDLSFTTAIGLVKWGAQLVSRGGSRKKRFTMNGKAIEKIQKMLRSLIP